MSDLSYDAIVAKPSTLSFLDLLSNGQRAKQVIPTADGPQVTDLGRKRPPTDIVNSV